MRRISSASAESIRHLADEAAQRIKEDIEDLLHFVELANRLRTQAPEFRPSPAQRKIFIALRGGKKLGRKAIERIPGVGRRAYSGGGSLDELLELGLADVQASKFLLTEPGEAMARQWLNNDSTDEET